MSGICGEPNFQLQPSHKLLSLKKSLRDIDIPVPPRKLFTHRSASVHGGSGDMFSDDDSDSDPYASDQFRMFEFKVRRCTRSRSHDWTDCPFAHPGEKARRRDPRRIQYSGTVCPEFRRGQCGRGDACEFSHGVFECWLHPSRYRTEACKDGRSCKRKVCFFAHTPSQLRVLPLNDNNSNKKNCTNMNPHSNNNNNNHCLVCCHCTSSTRSPTSTLFGMSHFSPPLSPPSPSSPTRFKYKDVFSELMCSMEGLNFGEASSLLAASSKPHNQKDVFSELMCSMEGLNFGEASSLLAASSKPHNQKQFINNILSSTITTNACGSFSNNGNGRIFREESGVVIDDVISPDLAWVNELLM